MCLRQLGLLPWKQGRIKARARSAGIRPLRYLSSRFSRFPQGLDCPPQAQRLAGLPALARDSEEGRVPARRGSPPGLGRENRQTQRSGQRVAGPTGPEHGHLPSLGPTTRSPRGSHVGARRDFPSARANFAAFDNEPGCRRVVVKEPDLKFSLAQTAHAASTASAFTSLQSRNRESLRKRTLGASHRPRPVDAQSVETKAELQKRCRRPGRTWEARARNERPGRLVTDLWLRWSAGWTGPPAPNAAEAGDVYPRKGLSLQVQNFVMAKQRSQEAGSLSITGQLAVVSK